jgi:hypothetical protein
VIWRWIHTGPHSQVIEIRERSDRSFSSNWKTASEATGFGDDRAAALQWPGGLRTDAS